SFTVAAAAATKLAYTTQPGSATAGSNFGQQPALRSEDNFGNPSTRSLAAGPNVTIAIQSGTATLQGTVTKDIGTSAGNGSVSYTVLRIVQSGVTPLPPSSPLFPYTPLFRSSFTVAAAAATKLAYTTQPGSATAGSNFGQQPALRSEDNFGNP